MDDEDGDAWSEDISCARDCGAAGARPLQSDEDRGHVTRLPAVLHPSSTTLPTHHTPHQPPVTQLDATRLYYLWSLLHFYAISICLFLVSQYYQQW